MLTATKIGRYEILGELGRGGMGVVYRAKDPLIGRTVALKTIPLVREGSGLTHEQVVERFQTEIQAAGRLTHPNIVTIYDAGESEGSGYIALELINGRSLQALLDGGEKYPIGRLLRIMEQVCSALGYAHSQGVVHRDIKPANIMLSGEDEVKITDFGTAKIMQYGAAAKSAVMGTPSYMSPEQVKGAQMDGRSDVFSLGVMMYEITTGKQPFRGKDIPSTLYNVLNVEPAAPRELNPQIPLGVSSTILKAMTKSPHLRYENCGDFLEDLKNYRPGNGSRPPQGNVSVASPKKAVVAERPAEAREKSFDAAMPQIPGVAAKSVAATSVAKPATKTEASGPAVIAAESSTFGQARTLERPTNVYAGPKANFEFAKIKRYLMISVGVFAGLWLIHFGMGLLGQKRPDSAAAAETEGAPATSLGGPVDRTSTPIFVTAANPQVATLEDLPQPWDSKSFIFYSATQSRNVLAMLVRLPGPATQSGSYWAFSVEAPFSRCEMKYVRDLQQLAAEYGVTSRHPVVVNPCTHTVFDPLHFQTTQGDTLVRGAILHGNDLRPPYAIEVKLSGKQILATAME